jgi:hypothetical protein
MIPVPGTDKILREFHSIPVYSSCIQKGLHRNRPERNTEDGSSIPAEFLPYWKRSSSNTFPAIV